MVNPHSSTITPLQFAEQYLQPFTTSGPEIIPELCPICHGGNGGDKNTFALNMYTGLWNCKRGSCAEEGSFNELTSRFGLEGEVYAPQNYNTKKEKTYTSPSTELSPLTDEIVEYFERRKISRETLEANKVASSKDGNIVFPFYWNGELIYVKHRPPRKVGKGERKEWQDKNTKPILFNMDNCAFNSQLIVTEGMCFPGDAEVLTPSGWTRFDQYIPETPVMSVRDDLTGEFVTPYAFIRKEYRGDLIAYRVGGNYASITTPDHDLVLKRKDTGALIKQRADSIGRGTHNIPTTIKFDGSGIPLSDDQISLYLAISADGTIDLKKTCRRTRFCVKKERKYLRMKGILDRLSIPYFDGDPRNNKRGMYYLGFETPDFVKEKLLPWEWVTTATLGQRKHILDEMVHWDGNSCSNRNQTEFVSLHKHNADVIQAIAHTCGIMSTIMTRKAGRLCGFGFAKNDHYKVSVLHGKEHISTQRHFAEHVPHDGLVYCVSVPTGMILVRQENKITVTGNCDSLSLYEAGLHNVVSVPSGCDNTEWVDHCWEWLEKFNNILIFGDADEPGQRMVKKLVKMLGEGRCSVIEDYPMRPGEDAPCKDPNEILYFYGPEKLKEMVEAAKPVEIKGIIRLADVKRIDYTTVPRITSGIPKFDHLVGGLHDGCLTLITGEPGAGKLLADQTPILTKDGWKRHGGLVAGDLVLGRNERWVEVQHIFPKGEANMWIKFSNGEKIVCHENHEWIVTWYNENNEFEMRRLTAAQLHANKYNASLYKIPWTEGVYVDTIGYCDPVPGNCIQVEGGIYRAGRTLIPTHNSTLNGTLLLNAIEQKYKVFAYSGELPKEQFLDWIICQAAGSDYIGVKEDRFRNRLMPHVDAKTEQAIKDWFADDFYLADNSVSVKDNQIDTITYLCEQAARRYGCHLFLIDNAMTAVADSGDERQAQIRLTAAMKRFALTYGGHVLLVAHPRKIPAGQQMGGNDVSGAKELYNLADVMFTVEKPDIRIIKNRDSGVTATIECVYCPDSRRIYQADVGDTYRYSWDKSKIKPPATLAKSMPEFAPRLKLRDPI